MAHGEPPNGSPSDAAAAGDFEDIGVCVTALFQQGQACIGRRVGLAAEQLRGEQMAQALSLALGEPVLHGLPHRRQPQASAARARSSLMRA